jgi:hypothetical protein
MSRKILSGRYEGGSFVLRNEKGIVFKRISPNTVFSIGNSINSYYAKRIFYSGKYMIASIRIDFSMRMFDAAKLKQNFKNVSGYILREGEGLWATSSSSARNGLWHRNHGFDNPIMLALRIADLPSNLLKFVDRIDAVVYRGGSLCSHSNKPGDYWYRLITDGTTSVMIEGSRVTNHFNKKHIGCLTSEDVIEVVGGTYLVQSITTKATNGLDYPSIKSVFTTPAADKKVVASVISNIMC